MKNEARSGLISLSLLLSACSTLSPSGQTASTFGSPLKPLPTRGFAGPATYVAPLPTAFILLKQSSTERNEAFCKAWLTTPTTAQILSESAVRKNTVETDWLVNDQTFIGSDCSAIVGAYAFPRADAYFTALAAAAKTQKQPLDLSGPGPFVVIVVPGVFEAGGTIVVNSSKFTDLSTFVQQYETTIIEVTIKLGSGVQSAATEAAAGPTDTAATGASGSGTTAHTSTAKPWYSGIFGFVTGIIAAVWPASAGFITILKTVVCG